MAGQMVLGPCPCGGPEGSVTGPEPSVTPGSGPGPRIRRRAGPSRAGQCKGGDSDKAQSKESQTVERGLPCKPGWVKGEGMVTWRGVENIAADEAK